MTSSDKWFFICNPIAGGGKMKKKWPLVQKVLRQEGIEYDYTFTKYNNHAIQITLDIINKGYRKLAIIGGDGSINELVNGIFMQKEVDPADIIFGLIPLGTANDWSRTHKIPRNIHKAVQLLKNGELLQQDVGRAWFYHDGAYISRYFNNVAGMSYDAFIVKYIEENGKKTMNKLKYMYYIIYCLFKFHLPKARIIYDGNEIDDYVYTINIGICKYSGGGLQLVPHAKPNDGKFAITVARNLSKLSVIMNTYRFYLGTIAEMSAVDTFETDLLEVEQSTDEKIMLELDGEFVGFTPVKFELIPGALHFIA